MKDYLANRRHYTFTCNFETNHTPNILDIHPSNHPPTYLPTYLSTYLPIYLPTYLSTSLHIYMSPALSLSVYLSVHNIALRNSNLAHKNLVQNFVFGLEGLFPLLWKPRWPVPVAAKSKA
jgi:hypothetical protein